MTTATTLPRLTPPPAPERPTATPSPSSTTRERAGLPVLLALTAFLYLWGLGESGWANSFYSAAAQAGSESWKAFLFGSSDAANSITVDKTPLALWPMALSVRIFGLSSWSILVPQALFGVASVGLLHATVRRVTGSRAAGLSAGMMLALTPVAVLMFRFNNPDALLTLLLIGAASATLRSIDASHAPAGGALGWLVLAGSLVGLAFLAKMLQALLVLPALVAAYAVFAAGPWRRRIGHLFAAFTALVVAGGWWVALVELWPGSRPYIGGSQGDSLLELMLGYNGLGRLTGDETGSVGGGMGWGRTGLTRLFDAQNGGQIAWLLPAALLVGAGGLWWARRDRRALAGLTVWLGWLLTTGLTFSLMAGIFHPYYSVALAPAVAAALVIGGRLVWRGRALLAARLIAAAALLATAGTAWVLLGRASGWLPWLRYAVAATGLVTTLLVLALPRLSDRAGRLVLASALLTALAAPTAYSLQTAATAHTGSIPSAGPAVAGGFGPGGGVGGPPGMTAPGGQPGGRPGGQGTGMPTPPQGGQPGGPGGLLDAATPSAQLTALLTDDAGAYTWVAAAVGSQSAAGYQLATQLPVMPVGGFNGSDPSPTLAEFQADVEAGRIHYFLAGGMAGPGGGPGGPTGGSRTSSEIASWVAETFDSTEVDGVTVYDLSAPAASGSASRS